MPDGFGFYLVGGDAIDPPECAYGYRIVVLRAIAAVIHRSFAIWIPCQSGKLYDTVGPCKKTLGCAIKISDKRFGDILRKGATCGGNTLHRSSERIAVVGGQVIPPARCPNPVVAAIERDSRTIGERNFKISHCPDRYKSAVRKHCEIM